MTIKAIETRYKGYRFRSRLEARWAVFFDTVGYIWRYEHQGYECGGQCYLPDFEIDDNRGHTFFVEVKGDPHALVKDWERFCVLLDYGGCLPNFGGSVYSNETGLILLGEIPDVSNFGAHFHPILQHDSGITKSWFTFSQFSPVLRVQGDAGLPELCGLESISGLDSGPENWVVESKSFPTKFHYPKVTEGYRLARAARFEHGEAPTPPVVSGRF